MKKGSGFCHGRFQLIQERRMQQSQRYERRRYQVERWMADPTFQPTGMLCHCGRAHQSIIVKERVHCPSVWLGWIKLFKPDFNLDWKEVMITRIPKNISPEETERWADRFAQQGNAALTALEKLRPDLAQAIRQILQERRERLLTIFHPNDLEEI